MIYNEKSQKHTLLGFFMMFEFFCFFLGEGGLVQSLTNPLYPHPSLRIRRDAILRTCTLHMRLAMANEEDLKTRMSSSENQLQFAATATHLFLHTVRGTLSVS